MVGRSLRVEVSRKKVLNAQIYQALTLLFFLLLRALER
jgi:hypothetical protein